MSEMKTHKHRPPSAIAQDVWNENKPALSDASTLGTVNPNYYFQNRLNQAFQDGWDAAARHYGHIIERLHKPQ